jgi:uncharacterized protein YjbI with pentapeptide repeats/beta-lactamase regulating signal transducer with metallopeptidase domain
LNVPYIIVAAIFAVWGIAAFALVARLGFALFKLEKLKRDALPLGVEYRDSLVKWQELAQRNRDVRICVTDGIEVPVAVGLFDAMVLLPQHLVTELAPEELDQVSLHELGHLLRNDDWTNALQRVVSALLFFNPAVWFVARQMDIEREVACDDYVLELTGAARTYAYCLTKMAERTAWPHQPLAAPGVFTTRKGISIRIERLLRTGRAIGRSISPVVAAAVVVGLFGGYVVARVFTPAVAFADTQPALDVVGQALPTAPPAPAAPPAPVVKAPVSKPQAPVTPKPQHAVVVADDINVPATTIPVIPAVPKISVTMPNISRIVAQAVGERMTGAHPHPGMNCTGCDFHGGDFAGRSFEGSNLEGADFHGANLNGASFEGANLEGADFNNADLRNANFTGANMEGADLRGARIDGATFKGTNVTGSSIDIRQLGGESMRQYLLACTTGCDLRGADLHGADLRGLHLEGADLRDANLRGANLDGGTFVGVDFSGADLRGASTNNTRFDGCTFTGAKLGNR